ncbi:Glyoxalase/bleomycin resistance/dioxygenase family protein [Glutamicibacter creatinolyticus]|uniref:Glyoxalase/bleomycin resistance/dioxygenase family protein n=1 Tax=Glutamicibacter creatinolyticus TaxID=162496 RepID=A0A5B7WVQ8_9MICC|nr:VOC family protein [Glutamicibacter creatinolyticus]QCY48216.1 Glyoxalase/bleomycin resistance/dioxygenase family protein [Glutamicibacter creatinolyticus]
MEILSSRVLLRPVDPVATQHFYRHTLGLAVAREFGPANAPGLVFHLGNGLLEVSGARTASEPSSLQLWLQVRQVGEEVRRLRTAGVKVLREPRTEPWGLIEAWIQDPDGTRIVLVQIPEDHPLRRDQRDLSG